MNKLRNFFTIAFIFLFCCLFILSLRNIKPINTDLISAFVPANSLETQNLIKLSRLMSNKINITFEADNFENLEKIKKDFFTKTDIKNLNGQGEEFSRIIELYKQYPRNFLTNHKRELLKSKNYKQIQQESLDELYNPMVAIIETPDKDPYLFLTDYLKSLSELSIIPYNDVISYDEKLYSTVTLTLNEKERGKLEEIIDAQRLVNFSGEGKVYLTGALIHSHKTSSAAKFEINIICMISFLILILFCRLYFKNLKILIPISLSIAFGGLVGYLVTNLIFQSVNILTFVFSTTLIGITLDYSLHYFLTKRGKSFYKSLTASMFTTVLAFFTLFFSDMEVLKEISIFTGFGIIGVYLFVILGFPLVKFKVENVTNIKVPNFYKYKKSILILLLIFLSIGLVGLKFNDDIRDVYAPGKELMQAEKLYKKVFNPQEKSFITVSGENFEKIIEQEDKIMSTKNVPYISISRIFPSRTRQVENQKLIQELYDGNLEQYAEFLNRENIENLKTATKDDKVLSPVFEDYPILNSFMLDERTSFIVVPANTANSVNITKELSNIIKNCRNDCVKILPIMLGIIAVILIILFGLKITGLILLPSIIGMVTALASLNLLNMSFNIFSLIGLFLILGFSLDYAIFRLSKEQNSEEAVLISCFSTVLSFFMLSFTSFKLISSLGIVLCIGISTAYLVSLTIIPKGKRNE